MWLIGLKICPFQYFPNSLKLGMGMILPATNDNTIIFFLQFEKCTLMKMLFVQQTHDHNVILKTDINF